MKRPRRGGLVLLVGAPGSGKSTWVWARPFTDGQVVSMDEFRAKLTGDMSDQSANSAAAHMQTIVVRERLSRGLLTVVDATNAWPNHRGVLLEIAAQWQAFTVAVVFDVPADVCVAWQAGRERKVPEPVIRKIDAAIREGLPGLPGEVDTVVTLRPGAHTAMDGRPMPRWLFRACDGFPPLPLHVG